MTWPAVFDGIGALVVNCALDPDVLADKIPGLTWVAVKTNGTDISDPAETNHCCDVWRSRELKVGSWVYCYGPPDTDVQSLWPGWLAKQPEFRVYDVEAEYKRDEGGNYEWAAELASIDLGAYSIPAAVTSYGAYKTSIDFAAFARAGWPIFAQAYDGFTVIDAESYAVRRGGPYPASGVHSLVRSLRLVQGQAVYRPESIDG